MLKEFKLRSLLCSGIQFIVEQSNVYLKYIEISEGILDALTRYWKK